MTQADDATYPGASATDDTQAPGTAAGGDVTAESGDGGRFRLTLPAARAPAELA